MPGIVHDPDLSILSADVTSREILVSTIYAEFDKKRETRGQRERGYFLEKRNDSTPKFQAARREGWLFAEERKGRSKRPFAAVCENINGTNGERAFLCTPPLLRSEV